MHASPVTLLLARILAAPFLLLLVATSTGAGAEPAWPQFRGPGGLAVAAEGHAPVHFGPERNVLWQIALPPGHSSPCIWGRKIFLTAFDEGKLDILCLDRRDGRILWRKPVPAEKIEPTHRIGSPAASTPATDGERVYVYFGSFGLLSYNLDGQEQWKLPLPIPMVEFGTVTSPILAGQLLILLCDQDQGSFLLALDKRTGRKVWRGPIGMPPRLRHALCLATRRRRGTGRSGIDLAALLQFAERDRALDLPRDFAGGQQHSHRRRRLALQRQLECRRRCERPDQHGVVCRFRPGPRQEQGRRLDAR